MKQRNINDLEQGDVFFRPILNRIENKKHITRQYSKKHLFFLKLQSHQFRNMN
ncbi:hypothetical protein [Bacillus sp. JJ1562]|uniref:hypothetical protein n=1 Tax=Bacillus sp. JJ1562 TaxID=3122960 RepID=UPI0030036A28